MRKWIARGAVGLTVLVSGAGAAFMVLAEMGERKLTRRVDVAVAPVAFRSDAASIERGAYLFKSRGCADCHGADGAGHVVVDDGKGLLVRAPDITPAPNGVVAAYTPVGLGAHGPPRRQARRHAGDDHAERGIQPLRRRRPRRGRRLCAPVAGRRRARRRKFACRCRSRRSTPPASFKDASEKIDHSLPPAQPVPEGITPAHGAYVANGCIGCHGAKLAGGKIPGAPPDWPPAAKLTPGPGSALDRYPTAEQFMAMLKTGKRPDGSSVSTVMPFASLKEMNEVDVRALYLHLRSLPARLLSRRSRTAISPGSRRRPTRLRPSDAALGSRETTAWTTRCGNGISTPSRSSTSSTARLTSDLTLPWPFSGSRIQKLIARSMPSAANAASCTDGAGSAMTRGTRGDRRLELRLQRAHVGAVGDLHRRRHEHARIGERGVLDPRA